MVNLSTQVGGSFFLLPGEGCRGLERGKAILKISGVNSFLVGIDMGLELPQEFVTNYELNRDSLAAGCSSQMIERFNVSLSGFKEKLALLEREKGALFLYMEDEKFLGRGKRELGTLVFAVIVSLSNLLASSLNIVLTNSNYHELNIRLNILSQTITELKTGQQNIVENIEFLHQETQFLGVETNLIVEHAEYSSFL